MRCSFVLLTLYLTLSGVLFAAGVHSQDLDQVKVDISLRQASLQESLLTLQRESGIRISFFDEQLQAEAKKVTLQAADISVAGALKKILAGTALRYRLVKDFVVIDAKPAVRQPGKILGKISDDAGEVLPGATVKIIETDAGMQTAADGTYELSVAPGTYTLEVSYIAFNTKRIADVVVYDGKVTRLDVVLTVATSTLNEVVIQSSYRKESINGLYTQQRNAASMTNGLSAEQIARTPDNNIGAALKRVSGVNTIDNKYVVVRGLTERYNQAMIDGIIVPSTDMNRRNFSFDAVPAELVSTIVVNKTATPDASSEFSGGQVTVNTLAVPEDDFVSITVGSGFNTRTIHKDFLVAGGRGKYDYLGFDDGRRKEPANLKGWTFGDPGDNPTLYVPEALEQSKRFRAQSYAIASLQPSLNQNYRVSAGKLYALKNDRKLGIVGGLTYRNTQENNPFVTVRGLSVASNYMDSSDIRGQGNIYKFNTTWGGLLNAGIQGEKFKLISRNLYTRMLNDDLYESYTYSENDHEKRRQLFQDPVLTDILQNKVEGEHTLGSKGFLLTWSGATTAIHQDHKDLRQFTYNKVKAPGTYYQAPGPDFFTSVPAPYEYDFRVWTDVSERDYTWMANASQPFTFLHDKSLVKVGYMGWHKTRAQRNMLARIYTQLNGQSQFNEPYEDLMTPDRIGYGLNQAYYFIDRENGGDQYSGVSKYHSFYGMLDQRFFKKLRAVYGVRAENFNLQNNQRAAERYNAAHPESRRPILAGEENWNFLPSVNATYSISSKMNVRAAYSTTMVRPDFRETAAFAFPDPLLRGSISGGNVTSTKIRNYDLRYEWYPSAGEIFSISGFYKEFDKPVELIRQQYANFYVFQNQKSATVLGGEMEFRKSLRFLGDRKWMENLSLFGNATVMRSEVVQMRVTEEGKILTYNTRRALFGQAPYIFNGGISYTAEHGGFNLVYNRTGYRTNYANSDPYTTEYENDRDIVDLQLSARFLKRKAEVRLNISNLLDNESMFYIVNRYAVSENGGDVILSSGSYKYEKGKDLVTHRVRYGRTVSASLTYNF